MNELTWIEAGLYGALAGLYLLSVHALTYRLLVVDRRLRPAMDSIIYRWSAQLSNDWNSQTALLGQHKACGWWTTCRFDQTPAQTLEKVARYRQLHSRYIAALQFCCGTATSIGLLGTVCAFLTADDVHKVSFSLAYMTTAIGMVISLIPGSYLHLTSTRRERLEEQFELVLEFGRAKLAQQREQAAQTKEEIGFDASKARSTAEIPSNSTLDDPAQREQNRESKGNKATPKTSTKSNERNGHLVQEAAS